MSDWNNCRECEQRRRIGKGGCAQHQRDAKAAIRERIAREVTRKREAALKVRAELAAKWRAKHGEAGRSDADE